MNQNTHYGNYAGVRDGQLYGRTGAQTPGYGRWDLASETLQAATALTGFNPQNTQGTFDWSGFSGLNTFTNQTSTYVVGGAAGITSDWHIQELSTNLTTSVVGDIANPSGNHFDGFGWAFLIGDFLFFSNDYNSDDVTSRYNVRTGAMETVDFNLQIAGNNWWSNTVYDHFTDTLTQ